MSIWDIMWYGHWRAIISLTAKIKFNIEFTKCGIFNWVNIFTCFELFFWFPFWFLLWSIGHIRGCGVGELGGCLWKGTNFQLEGEYILGICCATLWLWLIGPYCILETARKVGFKCSPLKKRNGNCVMIEVLAQATVVITLHHVNEPDQHSVHFTLRQSSMSIISQ